MTKEELIEKLKSKAISLSYSWLKNFTSPIDFLDYKLKPKKQNTGMMFGSVCDMLLLTPENFDKEFAIVNKVPSTDIQVAFVDEIIEWNEKNPDSELTAEQLQEIYKNHYSKGTYEKTYNGLKGYIEAVTSGKNIIDSETYQKAKALSEKLLEFPDIQRLFERIQGAQTFIEWTTDGWKFRGYLDFYTPEGIFDLKYSGKGANPEDFNKTISNLGYDLQAGAYCRGTVQMGLFEQMPAFYWLVYDDSGNYSIIEADYSYIRYGERKMDYYLQALNRCIREDAWEQSYNFFKRTYRAFKPKWAKAFVLEGEEEQI